MSNRALQYCSPVLRGLQIALRHVHRQRHPVHGLRRAPGAAKQALFATDTIADAITHTIAHAITHAFTHGVANTCTDGVTHAIADAVAHGVADALTDTSTNG